MQGSQSTVYCWNSAGLRQSWFELFWCNPWPCTRSHGRLTSSQRIRKLGAVTQRVVSHRIQTTSQGEPGAGANSRYKPKLNSNSSITRQTTAKTDEYSPMQSLQHRTHTTLPGQKCLHRNYTHIAGGQSPIARDPVSISVQHNHKYIHARIHTVRGILAHGVPLQHKAELGPTCKPLGTGKRRLRPAQLIREAEKTQDYVKAIANIDEMLQRGTLLCKDGLLVMQMYIKAEQPEKCEQVLDYLRLRNEPLTKHHYDLARTIQDRSVEHDDTHTVLGENIETGLYTEGDDHNVAAGAAAAMVRTDRHEGVKTQTAVLISKGNNPKNSLISYIEANNWREGLKLVKSLQKRQVTFDLDMYECALSLCAKGGQWRIALVLLKDMRAIGLTCDTLLYNRVIAACSKAGAADPALKLYSEMKQRGVQCDEDTYSVVLGACAKDTKGKHREALMVLDELSKDIVPSTLLYNRTISACATEGAWVKAVELLREMHTRGVVCDTFTYSKAISACAKAAETETALRLLREMDARDIPKGTAAYNGVIQAYAKVGDWANAQQILREMLRLHIPCNTASYNRAISACAKAGQYRPALELLGLMQATDISIDKYTLSHVLLACMENAKWEHAVEVLRDAPSMGVNCDTVLYNNAITVCANAGKWGEALKLLREMPSAGIQCDTMTYTQAIRACAKDGQCEEAILLLREMVERSIACNTDVYNAAISACQGHGQWKIALKLLEEMQGRGLQCTTNTYNIAIAMCKIDGVWEEACDLLRKMQEKSIACDIHSYRGVVTACATAGAWEPALELLAEMPAKGIRYDSHIYTSAISSCVKEGKWEAALDLFECMDAKDVRKSPAVYNAVIEVLGGQGSLTGRIDSLYDEMVTNLPEFATPWEGLQSSGELDLHNHTTHTARAAVRRLLRLTRMQRLRTLEAGEGGSSSVERLGLAVSGIQDASLARGQDAAPLKAIVVGMGNNSVSGRVVLPAVQAQLNNLCPPISSRLDTGNDGLLYLDQVDLEIWLSAEQNCKEASSTKLGESMKVAD